MDIAPNTPTQPRNIGGKTEDGRELSFELTIPTPYAEGYVCDEAHAKILNQTLAENISNNLRKKLLAGVTEGEGDAATTRDYTPAEAQALVDEYVADYEPGKTRGGGEPRVTDPVEKEARALAREAAKDFVKSQGMKPSDVDMPEITSSIFEANREALMSEAKKIVAARNKVHDNKISLEGINLAPKAPAAA